MVTPTESNRLSQVTWSEMLECKFWVLVQTN